MSIKKGHTECALFLIDQSFPVDIPKKNGVTALSMAAFQGSLPVVKALLRAGARIDTQSSKGLSPLHFAIRSKKLEVVKYVFDEQKDLQLDAWPVWEKSPLF